jgi:glycine cleavage system H lipoate-binding protein
MTNIQSSKQIAKTSLLYAGLALALIIALPLLAGLAYALRFLIPVLIVGALIALAVSPAARRWFVEEADDATDYKGVTLPTANLKVHPAHSWVSIEQGLARVGIDALALVALGKPSSVDTPAVGMKVEQGDTLFSISRGQRQLHVKAPIAGTVVAVNGSAAESPGTIASSAYETGWIVQLKDVRPSRQDTSLLGGKALRRWFRAEVDRLITMLAPAGAAPTMADGGALSPDLGAQIDDRQWAEVAAQLFANTRA